MNELTQDTTDEEYDIHDDYECIRAKWTIDGATTLGEAADKLRAFADHLQALHDEGTHALLGPVRDDYCWYKR